MPNGGCSSLYWNSRFILPWIKGNAPSKLLLWTFKHGIMNTAVVTIVWMGDNCFLAGLKRDTRTQQPEVKFLDLLKTNRCESDCQIRIQWSRTKFKGSKMIRYRRSLGHKLCRLTLGDDSYTIFRGYWETKVFGFWGEYMRKHET